MLTRQIQPGIQLMYHRDDDGDVIDLFVNAGRDIIACIQETWGLPAPHRCPVYLATSWLSFYLLTAPWYMQIIFVCYLPLWWYQISRQWETAAGWMVRYIDYPAVAVKAPRLIAQSDRRIGQIIFRSAPDAIDKARHTLCHELTHAFTYRCKLPMWLNEGLAMLTVDKYVGYQTVRSDTLHAIRLRAGQVLPVVYAQLRNLQVTDIAYHYTRGYWITRYLHEMHPDLLSTLLVQTPSGDTITNRLVAALGMTPKQFWADIDMLVVEHFAGLLEEEMVVE